MGVPRLFPWFTKSFSKAVRHFPAGKYRKGIDYMYLDANGLLHGAAQTVYNYGDGKRKLDQYGRLSDRSKRIKVYSIFFENLRRMTHTVIPKKVLYIAIDGPAPIAKQNQQRERRFVAAQMRLDEESKSGAPRFDSSSITPGTVFMHELTRYINYAIRKEINSCKSWKNVTVYFSPPTVPGEGEHKIMDFIRDLPLAEREKASHCLFGPDGDLIMLALAAHVPNMWLFREDQYRPGYLHLLDMGLARVELAKTLGIVSQKRNFNDASDDFIIEGFFVGNDFLPKIQMFHLIEDGLEYMMGTYSYTSDRGQKNFLTVNGEFNFSGFKVFVDHLSQKEECFLIDQVTTRNRRKHPPSAKFKNKTLRDCISETTKTGDREPVYTLDMEKYRKDYYAKCMFPNSPGDADFNAALEKMCRDYLRSFVWVFKYYVHGLPDWKWAYEHHYAPLMVDFNNYVQSLNKEDAENVMEFHLQKASVPFEQLLSVLPPPSAHLLPKPYQNLMLSPKSLLVKKGYYPGEVSIDYEGKLKEWQGVALLPFVDYNVIHQNYEKITRQRVRNPERYVRNGKGRVAMFKYDGTYKSRFTSDMGNINELHVRKKLV